MLLERLRDLKKSDLVEIVSTHSFSTENWKILHTVLFAFPMTGRMCFTIKTLLIDTVRMN